MWKATRVTEWAFCQIILKEDSDFFTGRFLNRMRKRSDKRWSPKRSHRVPWSSPELIPSHSEIPKSFMSMKLPPYPPAPPLKKNSGPVLIKLLSQLHTPCGTHDSVSRSFLNLWELNPGNTAAPISSEFIALANLITKTQMRFGWKKHFEVNLWEFTRLFPVSKLP